MKEYIKNNLTAILIGFNVANLIWFVCELISDTILKIAIINNH